MHRTLDFEIAPDRLTVLLFTNVTNSADIRSAIVAKTLQPEAAFLNARLLPDLFLLHVAANKALHDQKLGKLTTHALHSELVFNVSGSRHISESLTKFGVSNTTDALLVARVNATDADLDALRALVKGTEVDLEQLSSLGDEAALKKAFKCADQELAVGSLLDCALCKIAARDC